MGQYNIRLKPSGSSSEQISGQTGSDDSRREFDVVVLSDPRVETTETVKIFAGLPKRGDYHPNNRAKVCTGVEVQQRSPICYDAVANYSLPITMGATKGSQQPWDQSPNIKYSWAVTEEQVDRDVNGKFILTKTGETFDPPLRRPFGDLVLTVERNVLVFDPLAANDYLFTVNADQFHGFPPGVALITHFEAEQIFYPPGKSSYYYRRAAAVQFRKPRKDPNGKPDPKKAWWWRQLAAGYKWYVPRDGVTKKPNRTATNHVTYEDAFDDHGRPATRPVLHNKDTGFPLFSDPTTITYNPTNAQWYEFQIYEEKPFSKVQIL